MDYVAVYETGSGATTTPSTAPPSTAPPSTAPPSTAPPSTAPPSTAPPSTGAPTTPPGGQQCTTTATSDISADCFGTSQGSAPISAAGDTNPAGVDGNQVAQLSSGTWLEYPGVNFGTGSSQFDARAASGAAGGVSGVVNVVLDNPGNAPIGSFAISNTGGWTSWRTIPAANITKTTGTHNVYLEFQSGAGANLPFVSLHYFSFPAQ